MRRPVYPEQILAMTDEERRKLRRRVRRLKTETRDFSREELIGYLREKKCLSSRDLAKSRGEGEPTVYDYRKEFGSWQAAKEVVFGKKTPPVYNKTNPKYTASYLVKTVIQFQIGSKGDWKRLHKSIPETVPSLMTVYRRFGSWSFLKRCAENTNVHKMLERYFILTRKLGREPTIPEAEKEEIAVKKLVEWFWGSKKELDRFVSGLERQREKRNGS